MGGMAVASSCVYDLDKIAVEIEHVVSFNREVLL